MIKFEEFRVKEKFVKDTINYYPGISKPHLKPVLTEKINEAANDFEVLAKKGHTEENEYQKAIETGLGRFRDVYLDLDTEDRERVCYYFEELMDIVGLESSNGQLNTFIYSFDPK